MTAVWIESVSDIELHRQPPGDMIKIREGRFDLPPGRTLTLRVPSYVSQAEMNVTVEAIEGNLLVGGQELRARVVGQRFRATRDGLVIRGA